MCRLQPLRGTNSRIGPTTPFAKALNPSFPMSVNGSVLGEGLLVLTASIAFPAFPHCPDTGNTV